eukprot:1192415-Prorocentrum_minimum.AAC.3
MSLGFRAHPRSSRRKARGVCVSRAKWTRKMTSVASNHPRIWSLPEENPTRVGATSDTCSTDTYRYPPT